MRHIWIDNRYGHATGWFSTLEALLNNMVKHPPMKWPETNHTFSFTVEKWVEGEYKAAERIEYYYVYATKTVMTKKDYRTEVLGFKS